ncbi:MAG: heme-binding protein [Pseudomonadota bacterium]
MNRLARHLTPVLVILSCGALPTGEAVALEEPPYTVVDTRNGYEIRRYEPYIVAELDVAANSEREAGGNAFRVLAAYIFGDNRQRTKMAMTVPVETSAADTAVAMSMTAPAETRADDSIFTYAFVMERKYTLDSLPEPLDSRIRIRERSARHVAALRFSGSARQAAYDRRRTELALALRADRITPVSGYSLARYNGPYTPPFLRRNEVLVDIDWPPQKTTASR